MVGRDRHGKALHSFLPASAAMSSSLQRPRLSVHNGDRDARGPRVRLVPSRIAARLDLNQALRRDTVGGRLLFRRLDGQSLLSAIQVALSLVLVIAAALFARTFTTCDPWRLDSSRNTSCSRRWIRSRADTRRSEPESCMTNC